MSKITITEKISLLLSIGVLLIFSSLLALWDLARHQVELRTGFYDLPFGYTVPWWFAGDIFVVLGIIGMIFLILWGLLVD